MRWTRWAGVVSIFGALALFSGALSCGGAKTESATGQHQEMTAEQKVARGHAIAWSSGCNDCHTPGTFYGTPDTTRTLAGTELGWTGPWGTSYPRNLTPDSTGIITWTEEQIVTAFRQGHRPDGTPLLPPMPWPSYAHMSDEDAYALAAYIKSVPPVHHVNPARLPPGAKAPAALVFPPPTAWDAQNLPPPTATP